MAQYEWTLETYERLAEAAISPWSVAWVLEHPVVRRHIGSALTVAGPDRDRRWISVAAYEKPGHDDIYVIYGARELEPEEIETIRRILRGDM